MNATELTDSAQDLLLATDLKNVSILTDSEAINQLRNTAFQKMWGRLYESCPWATAFQSPEFASSWYTINLEKYIPILISKEVDGELVGLLAMAVLRDIDTMSTLRNNRKRIVAVGNYEAEYQTWLANAAHEKTFIKKAFSLLMSRFPDHDIYFRFIPAGVNISCLTSDPVWKRMCVFQAFKRPLMEMNSPEVMKLFKKRGFKLKLNRLKRLGEVKFEHITDLDQFFSFYDQLILQYDFRQGAMFNRNLFKDSPESKALLIELFKHNLLHTTVLSIKGEVVASIVGIAAKNWVHLGGINTHSPFYAVHSPGFVHFLSLGQLLASEQSDTVFDLTPGGDAYKERMATNHDVVHELLISPSASYRIKRRLRKIIHYKLIDAGHRPMSIELGLKKKLYLLRARLKALRKGQWSTKQALALLPYPVACTAAPLPAAVNSLQDLLCHEPGGSRATRWEFLEEAMTRFEGGQRAYTYATPDRLLACVWLPAPAEKGQEEQPEPQDRTPELTYCQPGFANQLPAFLAGVAADLALSNVPLSRHFKADLNDRQLLEALRTAGLQQVTR